ncbi:hypothetical protein [Tardiphaga sp.]|uniref:hypothetical protein n=1 Tax=Tardiphaga sp. TaxID=1926292 RepID=UPI0026357B90|nr:hypothetical protein [Tardiphaga sp.]
MKIKVTIRRMLSILMIAGLALAPVSRPVMAESSADVPMAAMSDETIAPSMAQESMAQEMAGEMASDMPCCPSKAAVPSGCDKCVFMAACMTKCFAGVSEAAFEPVFTTAGSLSLPQNDFWPDGLGHPPPDHPPRTSI